MKLTSTKLLTVVTVCFNAEKEIEATIISVIKKKTTEIAYLVLDGGSTDGTLSIIQKYQSQIDIFLSEEDNGIYDAMNKAIQLCKSNFILFVNAGDIVKELPLDLLKQHNDASLLAFPVLVNNSETIYPQNSILTKLKNTFPHQGCFYKVHEKLKYNLSYKIYADYALNLSILKNFEQVITFKNPIVAIHNLDGISNQKTSAKEFFSLVKNENGIFCYGVSFFYFKLRGLVKRFVCF